LFYSNGTPVGCSYFKNIMIPTRTLQITFSRQAVRSNDVKKVLMSTIKKRRYFPKTSKFSSYDEESKNVGLSASYNLISGVLTFIFVLQSIVHLLKSSVLTADLKFSYLYRSLAG
jgi:hypothetical protein